MKIFTLLLSIFICSTSNLIAQEIFALNFSKSNSKKFTVIKKGKQYFFKAQNKENKEVQSCKWTATLNKKEIEKLKESLLLLINNNHKKDINNIYEVFRKKDEIKLLLKDSQCKAKHKLYYFQKHCF